MWRLVVVEINSFTGRPCKEDRQVCVGVEVAKESLFRGSKIVGKMLYNETHQSQEKKRDIHDRNCKPRQSNK